jgi:hypothetical protein
LLSLALLFLPRLAEAQYKNGQFGFEGGYFFIGEDSGLTSHNFAIGMRGAYKNTDQWWFSARAMVSFPGDIGGRDNTVVLLHLVPVDVRYYFQTDSFRPFVGVTNSFQFLFNQEIESDVFWGPGVTAGMEIRLRRDIFLGIEIDAYWMFVFEGPDAPLISVTPQLIFFL